MGDYIIALGYCDHKNSGFVILYKKEKKGKRRKARRTGGTHKFINIRYDSTYWNIWT